MSNEFVIPPWARISGGRYDWLSNTAAFPSTFTGTIRSVDRLGDRISVSFSSQNVSHSESAPTRSLLSALRARMRGQYARVWYTDSGYTPRGSFPVGELLTNNTFDNSTTGWTEQVATLTVADRTLRVRASGTALAPAVSRSSIAVTQYAPYVLRSFLYPRITNGSTYGVLISDGTDSQNGYGTSNYSTAKLVSLASTLQCYAGVINDSTPALGDFLDIPYTSLSRCALIDNGPNLLLQSDEFDATWTTTNATVDDQSASVTAPDGSATADALEENTTNGVHFVAQSVTVSSAAADYSLSVAVKAGTRGFCFLQMGVATNVSAYFSLTTGVASNTSVGASWANLRTFATDIGNGWWILTMVARKTSANTSLAVNIASASAAGTGTYVGVNGDDAIYLWRATLAQASVPTRLIQTTTTAQSATSQTGPGYYTKGWPASTNGLLLQDDWVQIGAQLNKVVAPVNSDAAGRAYLQLAYPLRTAPSDSDPVIIYQPYGRFIAVDNEGGFDFNPEGSNHEFQLVEDLSA